MANPHKGPRPIDADRYVGNRLRARRLLLGLTQTQVSDLVGLTYQQVHKYECGINRIAAGRLFMFAQVLDVEPGYFFHGLSSNVTRLPPVQSRPFLALSLHFAKLSPEHQHAVSALVRRLAADDPPAAATEQTGAMFSPLDRARLDVCNIVQALTGQATRLEFTSVHDPGILVRAMLEVAIEMAKEQDEAVELSRGAGPLCCELLELVSKLALAVRGIHRSEMSKLADIIAFNTAALHPLDLAPSTRNPQKDGDHA